jgi:hypothetical protein
MRVSVRTSVLASALAIAQPTLAWDYFVKGTGIYAGHQTGQANAAGDAAIGFAYAKSAPGRIMFEVYINRPTRADGEEIVIPVTVDGEEFSVGATMVDAGGMQMALTFSTRPEVSRLARRIQHSAGQVLVTFGPDILEFAGNDGGEDFAKMLDACGGGR